MIQGDRNTSFYHLYALARRKRNHIASVKDEMGEWITNDREVAEFFRRGFLSLYSTSHDTASLNPHLSAQWHGKFSEEVKCSLGNMASREEIKDALWSMKPYKAPSPDGLHAGFFQRFWLITSDSVNREVARAFATSKIPDYLNRTLIVLIPKMQGPETIGNYRPISLCNTIYKVITKVIVGQIKPHLDSIISPCQAAFIPRRRVRITSL